MNNERQYDIKIDNARNKSKNYEEEMHICMSNMENTVLDKIVYKEQVKSLEDKIKAIQEMDLSDFEKEIAMNKLKRDLSEAKEKIASLDDRFSAEKEKYDFNGHKKDKNDRITSSLEKSKEVAMENREKTKEDKEKMSRKKLAVVSKYIELYPDSEIAELVDYGLNINDIYDDNYKEIQNGLIDKDAAIKAKNVRESQERYNSMTNDQRQEAASNKYGIHSKQGKKAEATSVGIRKDIQRDRYNELLANDSSSVVNFVVNPSNSAGTTADPVQPENAANSNSNLNVNTTADPSLSQPGQPQPNVNNNSERPRLVSMISGAKNKLKEIYDNNPKAAVAACVAIGALSAAAIVAVAPVGFTALGSLATGVGSAGLIGSGSALTAAAEYEHNKSR